MKANEPEQYIKKSALIAEIENWKQYTLECGYKGQGDYEDGNKQGRLDTCDKFLSFLDTLEVKEVDLKKDSLTWKDINLIDHLLFDIKEDYDNGKLDKEEYYKEVLKKFKEQL